jgi:hypothetical protein
VICFALVYGDIFYRSLQTLFLEEDGSLFLLGATDEKN